MTTVRPLELNDVDQVVDRIVDRLALDAQLQPLVNPEITTQVLSNSLSELTDQTWVAEQQGVIVGHLFGALLESEPYGNGVWVGPDGASFDNTDILSDLYSSAGATWIERGALEHYVWTIDDIGSTQPWYEMGFARMHTRGVLRLDVDHDHELPAGYSLRRGNLDDLELAVALDDELDNVQRVGPSFSIGVDHSSKGTPWPSASPFRCRLGAARSNEPCTSARSPWTRSTDNSASARPWSTLDCVTPATPASNSSKRIGASRTVERGTSGWATGSSPPTCDSIAR